MRGAVDFKAELVEFPVAVCLFFFVSVARNEIACLDRQAVVINGVLKQCARRARRALRAQGNGRAALCIERVHFLLYHVGRIAHAALKQLCVLKHGRADFSVSVGGRLLAHDVLDKLPFVAVGGEHVLRAVYAFRNQSHSEEPLLYVKYRKIIAILPIIHVFPVRCKRFPA